MKKYELTANFKVVFGKKLFQIKALVDFGDVKSGELGGYIEREENLEHSGNAWVSGNAQVYGNAWVSGDAQVYGNAQVYGDAWVYGNAQVHGDARVSGNADILQITGLGTVHRTTTAFKSKNGVMISCGCFFGTIEQFEKRVVDTRDGKVKSEYLKFAELVRIYFGMAEDEKDV